MIELYHASMSVCSEKVRMALAEKGLDFVSHHFDLRAGHQQEPEYLKLNPNAIVPTLVHDGAVIIESAVINEYLDDVFPDPPLRTHDPVSRARMRVWWKQLDEGIHAFTGVISAALAFRFQHLRKSPPELDAYFGKMVDPVRRERMRNVVERGVESPHFAPALRRFEKLIVDMDGALERGPWLAGSDFSLADIAFCPYVTRLQHLQMSHLWDRKPQVGRWLASMQVRPSFEVSHTRWFTPAVVQLMREKGLEAEPRVKRILAE